MVVNLAKVLPRRYPLRSHANTTFVSAHKQEQVIIKKRTLCALSATN